MHTWSDAVHYMEHGNNAYVVNVNFDLVSRSISHLRMAIQENKFMLEYIRAHKSFSNSFRL